MLIKKKITVTHINYSIVNTETGACDDYETELFGRPSINKFIKSVSAGLPSKKYVVNLKQVSFKKVLFAMDQEEFMEHAERIGECE